MTVGARVTTPHAAAPTAHSAQDAPRRASNLWRASFAVAFAAVVIAAGATWLEVFDRLRTADPVPARGTPAAIVWSERVFRSEAELAAWLRRRGINYARWVRTHPAAVSILRSRDRPAVEAAGRGERAGRTSQPKQPDAAAQGPGARPDAAPRIGTLSLVAIGIAALALLLALGVAAVSSVSLAPIAELGGRVRSRAAAVSIRSRFSAMRFPDWGGLVPRAVFARAGGSPLPADRVVAVPARVTAPRASRTTARVTTAQPKAPLSTHDETTVAELRQVEARLAELEQALLAVAEQDRQGPTTPTTGLAEVPKAKPRTRSAPKQAPAKPRTRSAPKKQPPPSADESVPAVVEHVAPPTPRRRPATARPLQPAPVAEPAAPPRVVVAESAVPPVCEMRWSRGPISSQFCAVARRDDGREVTIRFSPFFPWRESGPPPETPEAATALRSLVESLEREGWTVAGRGDNWFSVHMLPPNPRS